jgi:DNA-binding transcriptional LysR family regulator
MKHPDLNLLVALYVLLEEQSVVAAARRMDLSPPAMSRTLARIRETVGDPILVRAGKRMVPTARALELRDLVRSTAESAIGLLQLSSADRLNQVERQFVIRANDVVVTSFGEKLLRRLRLEAPGVTVRFVSETDMEDNALREGRVDLWVGASNALDPEVRVQHVLTSRIVGLADVTHPIFNGEINAETFASFEHINVSRRGVSSGPIDEELGKVGLQRKVALVLPTYSMGCFALVDSQLLMPIPEFSVSGISKMTNKLKSFEIPLKLNTFMIRQAWHPRLNNDAVHRWLRSSIIEICSETDS